MQPDMPKDLAAYRLEQAEECLQGAESGMFKAL